MPVEPRVYKGLRDLLPDQIAARERMIATIRGVYEQYGFTPLSTPAMEYMDVLTGSAGQEAQQSIFRVKTPEDEPVGLRFDLTVPLARVVAQYKDLPKPFRRYQVASVWRADKPDKGRFREFTQFDIDSVGVESDMADTEIIAAMCDTLTALDVGGYRVKFSSRKILELLLAYAEVPNPLRISVLRNPDSVSEAFTEEVERPATDVFRVLDKLDKIGIEKVRLELTKGYKDESGDRIPGLGLRDDQVARIEEFLGIKGERRDDVLLRLREVFKTVPNSAAEIDVLARISDRLGHLGYESDRAMIDLSIARGLAYYTGPVFEAGLLDAPQFGSVFGGGRYDDLVLRFSGQCMSATGASIGVDRLLAALVELKRIKLRWATAEVLVTNFDAETREDCLSLAFELRRAGIPTELYLGSEKIGKQLKHANAQGIPLVIFYGGSEKKEGVVTVKDMQPGREVASQVASRSEWLEQRPGEIKVPRSDAVAAVKQLLNR